MCVFSLVALGLLWWRSCCLCGLRFWVFFVCLLVWYFCFHRLLCKDGEEPVNERNSGCIQIFQHCPHILGNYTVIHYSQNPVSLQHTTIDTRTGISGNRRHVNKPLVLDLRLHCVIH